MYKNLVKNKDTDRHSQISLKTINYLTTILTNFAKYGFVLTLIVKYYELWIIYSFIFIYFRRPTVNGDPAKVFEPIRLDEPMKLLEISNNGLTFRNSSHQRTIEFVHSILMNADKLMHDFEKKISRRKKRNLCTLR